MANKGSVEITYNSVTVPVIVDAMLVEVAQVFEADIKPMAQELTPVDRGTNRRSITTEVSRTDNGSMFAEIFTQSGYGGYLELGHRIRIGPRGTHGDQGIEPGPSDFVQGRPYLYPSFMAFLPALLLACKNGVSKLRRF